MRFGMRSAVRCRALPNGRLHDGCCVLQLYVARLCDICCVLRVCGLPVVCFMASVASYLFHAVSFVLHATYCTVRGTCRMLRAARYILHDACWMLHVAYCGTQPTAHSLHHATRHAARRCFASVQPAHRQARPRALRLCVCSCGAGRPRPPAASADRRARLCWYGHSRKQTNKPTQTNKQTTCTHCAHAQHGPSASVRTAAWAHVSVCLRRNRQGVLGIVLHFPEYTPPPPSAPRPQRAPSYVRTRAFSRAPASIHACACVHSRPRTFVCVRTRAYCLRIRAGAHSCACAHVRIVFAFA